MRVEKKIGKSGTGESGREYEDKNQFQLSEKAVLSKNCFTIGREDSLKQRMIKK